MFEKETKMSSSGYDTITQMSENSPILKYLSVGNVALLL